MFGEIEMAVFDGTGRSVDNTSGINALYSAFERAVEAQGIRNNAAHDIDQWVAAIPGFSPVTHQTYLFPIGGHWLTPSLPVPQANMKEVAELMLQNLLRLGVSMKPVLIHAGLSPAEVDALIDAQQRDLRNPAFRLYGKYHAVWSIRE